MKTVLYYEKSCVHNIINIRQRTDEKQFNGTENNSDLDSMINFKTIKSKAGQISICPFSFLLSPYISYLNIVLVIISNNKSIPSWIINNTEFCNQATCYWNV